MTTRSNAPCECGHDEERHATRVVRHHVHRRLLWLPDDLVVHDGPCSACECVAWRMSRWTTLPDGSRLHLDGAA